MFGTDMSPEIGGHMVSGDGIIVATTAQDGNSPRPVPTRSSSPSALTRRSRCSCRRPPGSSSPSTTRPLRRPGDGGLTRAIPQGGASVGRRPSAPLQTRRGHARAQRHPEGLGAVRALSDVSTRSARARCGAARQQRSGQVHPHEDRLGVEVADSGTMLLDGRPVRFDSTLRPRAPGSPRSTRS